MSMGYGSAPQQSPLASRVAVATYREYADAQRAVDYLSDQKFAVEDLAIVGSDLKSVEVVTGRLTWGTAALSGLGAGAWFGLFVGLLLGLFASSGRDWVTLMLWGLVYGGLFGLVFGLISYAFTAGRRDFTSRHSVVAMAYDILCKPVDAAEARSILAGLTDTPSGGVTTPPGL
ncbi:MAG TPA: general stress protein [Actinomycetes bacterium]